MKSSRLCDVSFCWNTQTVHTVHTAGIQSKSPHSATSTTDKSQPPPGGTALQQAVHHACCFACSHNSKLPHMVENFVLRRPLTMQSLWQEFYLYCYHIKLAYNAHLYLSCMECSKDFFRFSIPTEPSASASAPAALAAEAASHSPPLPSLLACSRKCQLLCRQGEVWGAQALLWLEKSASTDDLLVEGAGRSALLSGKLCSLLHPRVESWCIEAYKRSQC